MKPEYVKKVKNFADEYNINTLCFSHKMIGETSDPMIGDLPPGGASKIFEVASELKGKLEALE